MFGFSDDSSDFFEDPGGETILPDRNVFTRCNHHDSDFPARSNFGNSSGPSMINVLLLIPFEPVCEAVSELGGLRKHLHALFRQ